MPNSQPLQRFKAGFFKALAHPTRIRILRVVRRGERAVSEIEALLEADGSGPSQQLTFPRGWNVVEGRTDGTGLYDAVRDPEIVRWLNVAREIFNSQLIDFQRLKAAQARADELVASRQTEEATASLRQEFSEPASSCQRPPPWPLGTYFGGCIHFTSFSPSASTAWPRRASRRNPVASHGPWSSAGRGSSEPGRSLSAGATARADARASASLSPGVLLPSARAGAVQPSPRSVRAGSAHAGRPDGRRTPRSPRGWRPSLSRRRAPTSSRSRTACRSARRRGSSPASPGSG
ncbi:MAG: helix-turn-helix domain-containing protein [Chloroflexi bacterium]|nr:helix-turn-helix domain-containing protein [Chloroflexota bacterium]